MEKYEVIQIRVSPEQKSIIREMANLNHENMSEYILRLVIEDLNRQPVQQQETK